MKCPCVWRFLKVVVRHIDSRLITPCSCLGSDTRKGSRRAAFSCITALFKQYYTNRGTISRATMLMILIRGLIAGPAVSL